MSGESAATSSLISESTEPFRELSKAFIALGNLFNCEIKLLRLDFPIVDSGVSVDTRVSTGEKLVFSIELTAEPILVICVASVGEIFKFPIVDNRCKLSASLSNVSVLVRFIPVREVFNEVSCFEIEDKPNPPLEAVLNLPREEARASIPLVADVESDNISSSNCSIVVDTFSLPFELFIMRHNESFHHSHTLTVNLLLLLLFSFCNLFFIQRIWFVRVRGRLRTFLSKSV